MTRVPALREEPYMTTPSDYRTSIHFQPSGVYLQRGYEPLLTNWEDMAKRLLQMDHFGKQIGRYRQVSSLAHSLTFGMDPQQQLEAVYDHVISNYTWNGRSGDYIPERRLTEVLATKTGTAAELNVLLLALLADAGITADPVLISTRDHGGIQELYPIASQFNAVIVRAYVDGRFYFLDATSRHRPPGVLPPQALNSRGWLVRESKPEFIDVTAHDVHRRQIVVTGAVDEAGNLRGSIGIADHGYSAASQRQYLAQNDAESFVRERIFDGAGQVNLSGISVHDRHDLSKPLRTEAEFEMPNYAMVAGDMLYVNPQIVDRLGSNPLRLRERTFPVDMSYPTETVYSLHLEFPDGYGIVDVPPERSFATPGRGAGYSRVVRDAGSALSVQSRFQTRQVIFNPSDYSGIRSLFTEVVAAHGDQIVLRRGEPTPQADAALGEADQDGDGR